MDKSSKTRIGLLGGTFDPVHTGHLIIAQNAIEVFDLSSVLFIPCADPPHKQTRSLATACHRMNMLKAAIEHDLRLEASDIEITRGSTSYTIDTLTQLRKTYKLEQFFFIIGSDTLKELYMWKNIYKLLEMCEFATLERPGHNLCSLTPEELHLDPPWPERLLKNTASVCRVDISSSSIRHRIAEGMSIRYLVPTEVEIYIAEHNLYGR